jgi:hypothetical protein
VCCEASHHFVIQGNEFHPPLLTLIPYNNPKKKSQDDPNTQQQSKKKRVMVGAQAFGNALNGNG